MHFSLVVAVLPCLLSESHTVTLFTSELHLIFCAWSYFCDGIALWWQVCLCAVSRFWFSRSHDISTSVSWRKDYRGRGCPWHRHQALPWTPEGESHQVTLLAKNTVCVCVFVCVLVLVLLYLCTFVGNNLIFSHRVRKCLQSDGHLAGPNFSLDSFMAGTWCYVWGFRIKVLFEVVTVRS